MEHPIQVEFEFTPERYRSVTREMLRYSFKQRRLKIFGLILVGIAAVLLVISGGDFSGSAFGRYLPTLIMMVLFWFALLYFMPRLLLSKQQFPEPHPMRYLFADTEVKLSTENSESTMQWTGFIKAEETNEWLLLFQNNRIANAVLKSAVSQSDLERLRTLLRSKGLLKTPLTK